MSKAETKLIVMLTHNDKTVENAYEIFEECKEAKAEYWGFKEEGIPLEEMKKLYAYMKACGKKTFLEVVAYTEEECLEGAKMALECGCDILMGTIFSDAILAFCKEHELKYMPFVGKITERPSILDGSIEEMIEEANSYLVKGVYGIDLLAYRYTQDADELIRRFCEKVNGPVCIAGSINSYERIDTVRSAGACTFTIGGAFFENCFEGTFCEQINKVCDYIRNHK